MTNSAGVNEKPQIFIIAEVAQAHDGSIGILHSYIDAVKQMDTIFKRAL